MNQIKNATIQTDQNISSLKLVNYQLVFKYYSQKIRGRSYLNVVIKYPKTKHSNTNRRRRMYNGFHIILWD